jgi:glycosyltransferase involved in cell wall biosynthesis
VRLSIIIPSFNQAAYLEETLDSVLSQSASLEVELLVFDGGSTDGTVGILERLAPHLAHWESVPDRGQTHAINKGLARMTGDVWMYVNSDDLLVPDALARAMACFEDPAVTWVSGRCEIFVDSDAGAARPGVFPEPPERAKDYLAPWNRSSRQVFPFSGSCLMRAQIPGRIGSFDESYHYSMDIEYYCRAVFEGQFVQTLVPEVLARWRWHPGSKTMRRGIAYAFRADEVRIARRYADRLSADQRNELETEISIQEKWLPIRKAMWQRSEGRRWQALSTLTGAIARRPSLAHFRPWLGAVARVLAPV